MSDEALPTPEDEGPRLYVEEDPAPLVGRLADEGFRIVRIGGPPGDKRGLIEELRRALGLPDHMAPTYDALYDCLTDRLVMGEAPRLLVVLEASGALQLRDREALHAFVELYDQAGRFWQGRGGDLRLCLPA